jgi:hypothetical protein
MGKDPPPLLERILHVGHDCFKENLHFTGDNLGNVPDGKEG